MNDIITNKKTFEIRRDDRNFAIGDLISFVPLCANYSGSFSSVPFPFLYEITYKLNYVDFPEGIKKNYCILGIRKKHKFI